jgi:molecular chaperone DnaK (HSP70)
MAKKFSDQKVKEDMKLWPFEVIGDKKDRAIIRVMEKGSTKEFLPEEISSMILQNLKN